jgi:hypothetical protein
LLWPRGPGRTGEVLFPVGWLCSTGKLSGIGRRVVSCGIGSQTLGGIIRDSGSDRKAFGGRDSCGAGKVCGHSGVGVIGFSGIEAVQIIPVIMWGTDMIVPGAALYLSHKGHFCLWS